MYTVTELTPPIRLFDQLHTMQRNLPRGGVGARAKGENAELRADLNSQYRDPRKEAIKRVIASMTGQYT